MGSKSKSAWSIHLIVEAMQDAFIKFIPLNQIRNPVMFPVYIGAILTTGLFFQALYTKGDASTNFIFAITCWLWFTLYFAHFAEALAEGRGKAQAKNLRAARCDIQAKKLKTPTRHAKIKRIQSMQLKMGDFVLVEAGDFIPSDGEVIEGIASVNESAITGESAPVIRESGGDRSAVTGGTQVISDWLIIRITADPGDTFIDKMIALVEGAQRQKTPNELALTILLAALTLVFLVTCASLLLFSIYSVNTQGAGEVISITVLVALFVCLAPTTIGGLLSAIGIAGMDRMIQANIIALSGRAIEAAGDVDVLILDKTGTITIGDRQACAFIPLQGINIETLTDAAVLASLADETAEGRSIVNFAKENYGIIEPARTPHATYISFSAHTRMSGVNLPHRHIRKGSPEAIKAYVQQLDGIFPQEAQDLVIKISSQGATALVVAEENHVLGVIHLKDQIKTGLRERFFQMRKMGIKTIMVTGDNHLTAAAIAGEAGLDDFLAETKPEDKLALIRRLQSEGHLVAMTGDGTNDAPALAQADVAVAMNTGTQAAKEAGNLVDLDSNPTKLIEVVEIGKQLLMTRGALTTFSIANDIAKYFAILPAAFSTMYPRLSYFNIMRLGTTESAILSAVIFNALIIMFLVPLALRGVKYRSVSAVILLRKHVLIYGVGGLVTPFIGIKVIDIILTGMN